MGSTVSAEKSAAKKTGCTVEQWRANRANGLLWCYECRAWKARSHFTIDRTRESGRAAICKPCNSQRSLRSKYRISREELAAIKTNNGGVCPICNRAKQKMEIDHNHKTGAVREWLCSRCNSALGMFAESVEILKNAINYLEKHSNG